MIVYSGIWQLESLIVWKVHVHGSVWFPVAFSILIALSFQMASELHGILSGAVSMITGERVMPTYGDEPEAFLRKVVFPIYEVIQKVQWSLDLVLNVFVLSFYIFLSVVWILKEAMKSRNGTTDHSVWRNYDDLNEFFWWESNLNTAWPKFTFHCSKLFRRNPLISGLQIAFR